MKKKTAENRMSELWQKTWGEIPPMAINFVKYYSKEYGACGEVCLMAFSAYAQLVEKLPCTTQTYQVDEKDKEALLQIMNEPQKIATQSKKVMTHNQNTKQ